jgi:subtilase family serine protease
MLVTYLIAGSVHLFAQTAVTEIVTNPIQTKGNAQPGVVGLTPAQVRHAYGFDNLTSQGAGQTIALIEAFGDQSIEKDLAKFNAQFNLPPCTTSNGCLRVLSTNGKNLGTSQLWSLETALDAEWAHAIAPAATIMVVESPSDHLNEMLDAVDFAVHQGATVVSMSWGGLEFVGETVLDSHFFAPNVSFVASSGDFGSQFGPLYPAASPYVLAVGGTTLNISDSLGTYAGETAWSSSGGGQSIGELEPAYQQNFPIRNNPNRVRGNPDVAYDADPNTGFAVFTTVSIQGFNGWIQVAGTSAGAPQWSALIALAKSMGWKPAPLTGTNAAIYRAASGAGSYRANFHDITSGSNGMCGTICFAGKGYDYVTGLGSPQADNLVDALLAE